MKKDPGKVQQLLAQLLPHTNMYEPQKPLVTLPATSEHENDVAAAVRVMPPRICAKMSLVAHPNQKYTGEEILGNTAQPSQINMLQSHHTPLELIS